MKFFFVVVLILSVFLAGIHFYKASDNDILSTINYSTALGSKAKSLKHYAQENGYNSQIGFIIDMNIHSGSNRFFIYDFDKDSIVEKGLVAHGRCNQRFLEGRKYANTIGCGCSSLGKYKIGKSYKGKFGLAYKLYGLDTTNDNAFKRFVVLHAHECIPEEPVYPLPICQSDGCPTVSPQFIVRLGKIIDASPKPILLFIFDEK